MNKAELVTAMATETGLSKKDVESVLNLGTKVTMKKVIKKAKDTVESESNICTTA